VNIAIYSDLHLELLKELPKLRPHSADLVILAGDIHQGVEGIRWAKSTFKHQLVVYVMGNHEYYHSDIVSTLANARNEAACSNVHLLEQDVLELPSATVLGCTLWTDFGLLGPERAAMCKTTALNNVSDYQLISLGNRTTHPDDMRRISRESYHWLDRQIQGASKSVIVATHYGPSQLTANPIHAVDSMAASFVNNYDALLRAPVKLWVTGHTHHCMDQSHFGIRIVSNQKGYPQEKIEGFNWEHMVDIPI
jgi:hypothetical protein